MRVGDEEEDNDGDQPHPLEQPVTAAPAPAAAAAAPPPAPAPIPPATGRVDEEKEKEKEVEEEDVNDVDEDDSDTESSSGESDRESTAATVTTSAETTTTVTASASVTTTTTTAVAAARAQTKKKAPPNKKKSNKRPLITAIAQRKSVVNHYDVEAGLKPGEPIPYLLLARAFSIIEGTPQRLVKTEHLANVLRTIIFQTPADLIPALYLIAGKVCNPLSNSSLPPFFSYRPPSLSTVFPPYWHRLVPIILE